MATLSTRPASRVRPALLGTTRLFNHLVLRLAGTRLLPLYGVLEHRGRRSGRLYRTPVVVRPTPDGFVVPMPWGEGTDWYRNIRAAGGCTIAWNGRRYALTDPQPIDAAAALPFFSAVQQAGMQRFGIQRCVCLRQRA